MDAQSPFASPGGFPLATGRLTVEQDIVFLCRQTRAFAEQLGLGDQDLRGLSVATYETARRVREAGASGEAELWLGDGPTLQIVVHALAPKGVLEKLRDSISPLRSIIDLSIFCTPDGLTIRASVPVSCGIPELQETLPAYLPDGQDGVAASGSPAAVDSRALASPDCVSPLDLVSQDGLDSRAGAPREGELAARQVLDDLRAELEEANRGVVALYGELGDRTDRLHESVAERTKLEGELIRRARDLAAANHAIEDFLSTLSHELRTPLNAMLGWTRLLRMGHLDEAATERALETIERNAHVQEQLISDILDASRIVTGQLQLDVRSVGMAALINAAVEALRPAADAKGITFETAVRFRGRVRGDPDRLQQIVRNLLENAIKFTPAAGHILVSLERTGGDVALTVSDTGQGIAQEFLPFVFERFRQGDTSATRSHGGLGLGLSIVRHIVELHGGRVQAASDGPGLGASFSIYLPVGA